MTKRWQVFQAASVARYDTLLFALQAWPRIKPQGV